MKRKIYTKLGYDYCIKCKTKNNLHLHHKFYAPDSVTKNSQTHQRRKEALEHPERFELLCQSCHTTHHLKGKARPDLRGRPGWSKGMKMPLEYRLRIKEIMKNRIRDSKGRFTSEWESNYFHG